MQSLSSTAIRGNPVAAFRAYLSEVKLQSPRTVKRYVALLARLQNVLGGPAALLGADTPTLVDFLRMGKSRGRDAARKGWNLNRSGLRSFYGFAVSRGVIDADPSASIERQRTTSAEPEPLSLSEMVRLVDAVQEHSPRAYCSRNVALVQVFLHTGLRVAEVVGLDRSQVDLDEHLLRGVRRKGDKVFSCSINNVASEALAEHLAARDRLQRNDGETALFVSHYGTRLAVRTVQELVAAYGKLAGIQRPVTPHLLRHSTLTQLSALGTPIRTIQDISGHRSLATTQRYLHVGPAERREAIARLGAAFSDEQRRSAA